MALKTCFVLLCISALLESTLGLNRKGSAIYFDCDDDDDASTINFNTRILSMNISSHGDSASKSTCLRRNWYDVGYLQQTIEELYIVGCKIEHLDHLSEIARFTRLRWLEVNSVGISIFNYGYAFGASLEVLILDNNPITKFEGNAAALDHLQSLSLRNTSISQLPFEDLNKMPMLREVHANGPNLNDDPYVVCQRLPKLEKYNYHSCPNIRVDTTTIEANSSTSHGNNHNISTLVVVLSFFLTSRMFGSNTMLLVVLLLSSFAITYSSQINDVLTIENDPNLYKYLHANHLEQYAGNRATQITEIRMDNNKILGLASDTFEDFPQLTYLYLSHNRIATLVLEMEALRVLDVSHNMITSIPPEVLTSLPSLQKLDASANDIAQIDWHNNMLENVNLSGNIHLTDVSIDSATLRILNLSNTTVQRLQLNTPNLEQLHVRCASGPILGSLNFTTICKDIPKATLTFINKTTQLSDTLRCSSIVYDYESSRNAEKAINEIETVVARNESDGGIINNDIAAMQRNGVGCEFSTLMVTTDDVILTQQEFFYVKLLIYSVIGCLALIVFGLIMGCVYLMRKNSYEALGNDA